jgi:ubiquinone/menaquinone biosynthesis C-methylase UbiE
MLERKSDKERAFLHDLYIETDWGERFAELIDEHVELPKEGTALYINAGSGGHAMALQERGGEKLKLIAVDESEECIELARAKAAALHEKTQFQCEVSDNLPFADEQFDLVFSNNSFTSPVDFTRHLAEAVRVARAGAKVATWLPTASSFGEFFSVYWEALLSAELADHGVDVENLITQLPTISDAEAIAEETGLQEISSWTAIEEFDFDSGQEFLNSPLINDFLLESWMRELPAAARQRVIQELRRIIDEERHEREFALSVKATLVVGTKARVQ